MADTNYYKTRVRVKGQITVPGPIREALGVEEGDDLLFYIAEDGRVMVETLKTISPEQAWFWTERWQKMEREAQADIDAGRVARFGSVDDAVTALERGMNAGD